MAAVAAFSLLSLGILALGKWAPLRLQTIGGVAVRAVLLLFPPAARNALALLNCAQATVPLSGCASLNGCSSGGGGGSGCRSSTVPVNLLASNPYYVCWATGGAHTAGAWRVYHAPGR